MTLGFNLTHNHNRRSSMSKSSSNWNKINKDKMKIYYKRWVDKNKEKRQQIQKKYREKLKQMGKTYKKLYKYDRGLESKKYREKYPQRVKANRLLNEALKYNRVKKNEFCQVCGTVAVIAHHYDYNKPLEVIWVCRQCHAKIHTKIN